MYICPECGEKLDKDVTICPCCGRGNKDHHHNKLFYNIIIFSLIACSVIIIMFVSSSYEKQEMVYNGINYSFIYKKGNWAKSEKIEPIDKGSDILIFNNDEDIYLQFDKEMIDLGFDVDNDSSREDLYNLFYKEFIISQKREYSNISSSFNKIGEKYYLSLNYQNTKIQARMYILCYSTKAMSFYIIHNGKDYQKAEEKLLDIFNKLELKEKN